MQSAVTGKDEEADKWRKLTNNFFTTKKCAQEEKIKILNKVINGKQKQIDALQSILETANEKFNNRLDLIHKDFERYGHLMYETTFKNMFKPNVIKHIIELSEDEKFSLEKME